MTIVVFIVMSLIDIWLLQINWENQLLGNSHCAVYITVDGTDFRIKEPSPFSPSWYSHKFEGPGVRYEIGICITTGWIVWINGPYRCGTWPDLSIARDCLHEALDNGERYIADGGYSCAEALIPNDATTWHEKNYMAMARARHETVNEFSKEFRVIGN